MNAVVGRAYIAGPTFGVWACRGRRFVVRSIEPMVVNVLGKRFTHNMIEVAFMVRGRVVTDCLSMDEWGDVQEVPS